MKIFFPIIVAVTLGLISCNKNSSSDSNTSGLTTTAISGTWRITLFSEDAINQTANYSGYNFTFASNGTARAVRGSTTVNGTWTTGTDNSKSKFVLNFGSTDPWEEISEDWVVIGLSSTKIQLQHISGGDGGTDLLTFEKN